MTPEELEAKKAELRKLKDELNVAHNKAMEEINKVKQKGGDYKALIKKASADVKKAMENAK